MLNIGKLAPGGEAYYLDTVASGVEDYYTGAGEAPGYWTGAAAPALGLGGRVEPETLRTVLGATDPATGEPLVSAMSRRSVPGFDLTFRPPKSVSLLYGLAGADTSRQVRDAHDAAAAAALGYLERHAAFSRRGHAGAERVPVTGFVAAAFRHRTSRAGDPLLHTHVLVANLARACDDQQWRTLDARHLYVHAKTAGNLYQAHLRAELTRRLGVGWDEVRNGCADLAGVPKTVIRAFSQRRAQIEAHMQARGETSAKAAQTATLATRRAKTRDVEPQALGAEWLTRAAAMGFGPDQVAGLTGQRAAPGLEPEYVEAAATELAGPEGLTARASTFTRRDAVRAWCERLPDGAEVDRVVALADALLDPRSGAVVPLCHPQATARGLSGDRVIRRADGRIVPAAADERRYSTPELLALEQRLVAGAVARRHAGVAVACDAAVDAALACRPTLAGEQATMVRRLTGSGAGVEVVVGKAGAGKTFALDAARDAWKQSGIRVLGCALAARAAAELQAGAGIDSHTIDALLAALDRPGPAGGLAAGSVVVVDEAGMVGTRKLARLLDHAQHADAKVVLVGDHHQLPEIDAGGVFRGLVHRLPAVELVDNRRQAQAWERAALDELRAGDADAALAAYTAAGRVVTGDTAEAVREQLVADWWDARCEHDGPGEPGVMIAPRVSDVEDLNDRARARLAATGELTGPAVTAAGRAFQASDRIVCLRNDRRLGVVNGTQGQVTAVDPDGGTVTARLDGERRTVELPRAYLDGGHVAHGYAITGHKAQGLTTAQTWVLGSDAIYREWGYVALSRGRGANRLYVVAGTDHHAEELHAHDVREPVGDPLAGLAGALRRSRAQQLALDHTDGHPSVGPAQSSTDRASSALQRLDRLRTERARAVEEAAAAKRRLADATQQAGRRGVKRFLRRSNGRPAATEAARLAGDLDAWWQRIADLDAAIAASETALEDHQPHTQPWSGSGVQDTVDERARARLRRRVEAAEFDPPDYVLAALGPRPAERFDRQAWRVGVSTIETYRYAWSITDPHRPLGAPPADRAQRHAFDQAAVGLLGVQRRLAVDNSKEVVQGDHGRANDLGVGIA